MKSKDIMQLKKLSAEVVGTVAISHWRFLFGNAKDKINELNTLIQSIEGRKPARPKPPTKITFYEETGIMDKGATVEPIAHHPV